MPSLTLLYQRNNTPAFRSTDLHYAVINLSVYHSPDKHQDISFLRWNALLSSSHERSVQTNRHSIGVEEGEVSTAADEQVLMVAALIRRVWP